MSGWSEYAKFKEELRDGIARKAMFSSKDKFNPKPKIMSTEKTSLENENQPSCLGAVSGSFLFDKALLGKATIKQPEYVMGVDTYDKDALAYCFGRKVDGVFEIMLAKTMRDENEFKQEVENLAKYFNADVFRSGE